MPDPSRLEPQPASSAASIPVMRPRLPPAEKIVGYLREIDATATYANFGPLETRLRTRLAGLVDCDPDCIVTFANATLALTGLVGTSALDVWDVPCFAFPAVPQAVLSAGKRLRIRDIEAESLRLAPGAPQASAGRIDVLPFGVGVPATALADDGPDRIIDAAASLGAVNAPLRGLRPNDAVVFSLHATKVLGCGEGGFAVCGSPDRARRLRTWSNFGFHGSRESGVAGTNAKLNEYSAAVAHAALDAWPEEAAEWRRAQTLVRGIGSARGLRTLEPNPPEVSPYWIVMFSGPEALQQVEGEFAARGIGTRRWWSRGLHRMPAFAAAATGEYPVTEWVAERYLGLPVFPGISAAAVEAIASALDRAHHRPSAART
jgi:dTDP-4-amino-4,6-dideoxygalactose transaminase